MVNNHYNLYDLSKGTWNLGLITIYLSIYTNLFCTCYGASVDNCPSSSQEEKHGKVGFGLWRRGYQFCGKSYSWLPRMGWTGLWACSWGREIYICGKCEESSFMYNLDQGYFIETSILICTIPLINSFVFFLIGIHYGAGPNDHTIAQIKDAVRDGLRAVKNTIEDESVVMVSFFIFSGCS